MGDWVAQGKYTVLHLGKFYPPHNGGMETHLRDLAVNQTGRASVRVIVANSKRKNVEQITEGVHVTRLARWGTVASMPVCPGMIGGIRRAPADLVHLHAPNPGAAFAFLLSGHRGRLVITHHADTLGRRILRKMSDGFVRAAMERADAIIVTSERYLMSSIELERFRDKCRVIPLGITPAQMEEGSRAPEGDLRNPLGYPLLLAVGRLVPYKGFDILIQAMRHVNANLLLIGEGPQAPELHALIERNGLQRKVSMLGRVDDLRPYFQAASIFIMPSITRAEAFGMVQLEAMAAGLPVINTDIDSGVPEVSIHGKTGVTVKPGNVNELAEAIQLLLDRADLREEYGKAARDRVVKDFSLDLMVKRTLSVYEDVLGKA